jgi:hypothetical protein
MTNLLHCAALGVWLATVLPSPSVAPATLPLGRARDLYSAHARRLVRSYLRLQMLEMRKRDLDRVRSVIEGNLSINDLFSPPPTQAGSRGAAR